MCPAQSTPESVYPGYTTSMNGHGYVWTNDGWKLIPERIVVLPGYKGPCASDLVYTGPCTATSDISPVPRNKGQIRIRLTNDEYLTILKLDNHIHKLYKEVQESKLDGSKFNEVVTRSEAIKNNIALAHGVAGSKGSFYTFNGHYLVLIKFNPNFHMTAGSGSCGPKC
jgi:hypothetical protein